MEHDDTVRCLALPLAGHQLLVPNAVVAEVFAAESVAPVREGPDWLLGSVTWRGSLLPLVCMEAALGGSRPEPGSRSKVVVMKALSPGDTLKHYAVLLQGIPHQVLASGETVTRDPSMNGARPFVAVDLSMDGARASIPDLDALEQALLDVAEKWESIGSQDNREAEDA